MKTLKRIGAWFRRGWSWLECKRGFHDAEYEPRPDRMGGLFAPYTCRRCGHHSDGFPHPLPPPSTRKPAGWRTRIPAGRLDEAYEIDGVCRKDFSIRQFLVGPIDPNQRVEVALNTPGLPRRGHPHPTKTRQKCATITAVPMSTREGALWGVTCIYE